VIVLLRGESVSTKTVRKYLIKRGKGGSISRGSNEVLKGRATILQEASKKGCMREKCDNTLVLEYQRVRRCEKVVRIRNYN